MSHKPYTAIFLFYLGLVLSGCANNKTINELELKPKIQLARAKSSSEPVYFQQLVENYRTLFDNVESQEQRVRLINGFTKLLVSQLQMLQQKSALSPKQKQQLVKTATQLESFLSTSDDFNEQDQVLYQLARVYDGIDEVELSFNTLARLIEQYPNSPYLIEAKYRRAEILFFDGDYQQAVDIFKQVLLAKPNQQYHLMTTYMLAWSHFKLAEYQQSLTLFTDVLDFTTLNQLSEPVKDIPSLVAQMATRNKAFTEESFTMMSYMFALLDGVDSINHFFQQNKAPYSDLSYQALATYYLQERRYSDSVLVYQNLIENNRLNPENIVYELAILDLLEQAGYSEQLYNQRAYFVEHYAMGQPYWQASASSYKTQAFNKIKDIVFTLATEQFEQAQAMANQLGDKASMQQLNALFAKAIYWNKQYTQRYENDRHYEQSLLRLGHSYAASGDFKLAEKAYQRLAYSDITADTNIDHKNGTRVRSQASSDAAYALITLYQRWQEAALNNTKVIAQQIDAKKRFIQRYFFDVRALAVQISLAQQYFQLSRYPEVIVSVDNIFQPPYGQPAPLTKRQQLTLWLILADSHFALNQYAQAEQKYAKALTLVNQDSDQYKPLRAAFLRAIYKQGEQSLAQVDSSSGKLKTRFRQQSIAHFKRFLTMSYEGSLTLTARYELAMLYIQQQAWTHAIPYLQQLVKTPNSPWQQTDAQIKLAYAFEQNNQLEQAATLYATIWQTHPRSEQTQTMLWQAATLFEKLNNIEEARIAYRSYANNYPMPLAKTMAAQFKLSQIYQRNGELGKQKFWLQKLVESNKQAGNQSTERSRYLASMALKVFADESMARFNSIKLIQPFEQKLQQKQQSMASALQGYSDILALAVDEYATDANFNMAEIYRTFAKDLLNSERPNGLSELELQEYEFMLEEQAYPFEEKAIELHELNVKRISTGLDPNIEQSLSILAQLLPVRYFKKEQLEQDYADIH
ncbi:tetratricopeptide repeat protein [Thalassotalea aquiviva]|uniref:tetratricopeptide repeat protein n=1 Tax=Thalassotalea aquiviva TaxID=3242415 RepID=UPI00352A3E6B